jgi:hypothetical protein
VELHQVADNNLTVKSRLLQKVKQGFDLACSFAMANRKRIRFVSNKARKGESGRQTDTRTVLVEDLNEKGNFRLVYVRIVVNFILTFRHRASCV